MSPFRRRRFPGSSRRAGARTPKPPSTVDLIRQDLVWELQQRVCTPGLPVAFQTFRGEAFWTTQWPRLLRQCCEHLSMGCLAMLTGLTDAHDPGERALPPTLLGWLLHAVEKKGIYLRWAGDAFRMEAILSRVAKGPIRLRSEDGLALVRLGGPRMELDVSMGSGPGGQPRPFLHAPAFQEAWRSWCASTRHQKMAVGAILSLEWSSTWRTMAFEDMALALPSPARRKRLLDALCEGLRQEGLEASLQAKDILRLGRWMHCFQRNGWELDHPIWAAWGQALCRGLEQGPHPGPVGPAWLSVALGRPDEDLRLPPGWSWTPAMAHGLAQDLAALLLEPLRQMEAGGASTDDAQRQMRTRLKETLALETRLGRWGLMDRPGLVEWRATLETALGEDWERRMEALLGGLEEGLLHEHWREWKASGLEMKLAPGAPRRGAPRL